MFREHRAEFEVEARVLARDEGARPDRHQVAKLRRREVLAAVRGATGDLLLDPRHADDEKLVEVAREDREESEALEQRNRGVLCELEDALIEVEDAQVEVEQVVRGLAREGREYRGVLYAGLMIRDGKPRVLEFNARFGDPEAQPLLLRMKSDILPVLEATIEGRLAGQRVQWEERPSVCVVMASGGYPGPYEKGKPISGLEEAAQVPDTFVFHAGTALRDGKVVTAGGRVLGVTALGDGIQEAIQRAYEAAAKISWEGAYYRKDIGRKALQRKGEGAPR